jgi:cell division protein FtsI (penicillin-binding protein 3)
LEKNGADWGTAVVMEVRTGKVRAISNLTRQQSGNYEEVLNYAVAERVEPGSTFKLFSLLALLEDNYVSINDSVDLNQGQIQYYKRTMWDSEGAHHYNNVTVKTAFAKSSNVGISRLVNQFYTKTPERYLEHLSATGIDKPTGIAIQGEPAPIFKKDPSARDWYGTTLPWMSVGYELQVTPLQMLNFYNAVANGGRLMQPMLVEGTSQYGRIIDKYDPVVLKESICSEKTLLQLQQSMLAVVDSGTARSLWNEHYGIAGKTGTAQKLVNGTYASGQYLASFIGYFPAESPRYSIMVMVSNPTNGIYYGGSVAGPVFREIADKVYSHHLQIIEPVNSNDSLLLGMDVRSKGYGNDYRTIFDWFHIDVPDNAAGDWWLVDLQHSKADVDDIVIHEQTMPSVKGMGARDAIFLLESQGLKVQVSGVGKVVYQSVAPGAATYKGAQVQIRLG